MQLGMVSLQQLVCWAAQAVLLVAMAYQDVMRTTSLRTMVATVSQEEWAWQAAMALEQLVVQAVLPACCPRWAP